MDIETLFEVDGKDFWWKQCEKPKCKWHTTHDSEKYCYIHSRWYRRFKKPFNLLKTRIENWLEHTTKGKVNE